ncbi:prepilin peptidase [Candidatus Woesebacteria bacterium]|nr:MAG: prepilin peptidase [Candidatus Woesebacteria bacterium]
MEAIYLLLIIVSGFVMGSFITAYSYRAPRKKSIAKGRSFCDSCGKKISWYDNIPLFSYILLNSKSRCCNKKIGRRYPSIEISTAAIFSLMYFAYKNCSFAGNFPVLPSTVCSMRESFGIGALFLLLFAVVILISIFVIDFENQIIPDEPVFLLFTVAFLVFVLGTSPLLYQNLLVAFAVAAFFLLLNLITLGRGMGLGDVKLSLVLSFILGWPNSFVFLFASFVTGSIVGVFLILTGKAKFGKHIPFGPFLVFSFFMVLIFGPLFVFPMLPYY